jgi:outer membrane receptor protein involved in Fe transport
MTISKSVLGASLLAVMAAGACLASRPAAAQNGEGETSYNLPAQALADTLRQIARQSGREILFADDTVRGRRAPMLRGRFTPEGAVRQAIAGSGLVVDTQGSALLVLVGPRAALEPPAQEGADITVTGTRIRGAQGPSPVIVTTRRSLEEQGVPDLTVFSRVIPQNFTGGQNPGVAGGGNQGGHNNINNATTLNLRGLGSDATLTLINGHRLPYDAVNQGVDISTVPLAAIERIEIITDGASALYGSDAVGGVANILLRRDFDGVRASARYGAATGGGAEQQQYSLVGGARWASGGFMAAVEYSKTTPIFADQRAYTRHLQPSQMLSTRSAQTSAILAAHQALTPNATLEIDAQFAERSSQKANAFNLTSDVLTNGQINSPLVTSYAITPSLHVELGAGWETTLEMTQGRSRTLIRSLRIVNGAQRPGRILYQNRLTNVEASAEGPLFQLPGGDARLALGGGARWFALDAKSRTFTGGVWQTTRDATESRQSLFGYGELSLPLVGPTNRMDFLEELRLSAAIRYERYDGIDEVGTPKLGLAYAPHRDVTLKLSWGKSFKIPTLNQVNTVREGILLPVSMFTQPSPPLPAGATIFLLGGGNPDLTAERATNTTLSIELRPRFLEGLRIEASWFDIDYRDRIASPITNTLASLADPLVADFVDLSPTQQQLLDYIATLPLGLSNQTGRPFDPANVAAIVDTSLRNTAREHVQGVDLALDYRADLGGSQLRLAGSASYLDVDRQLRPGQPTAPRTGVIFTPPHWRARGSASWETREVQLGVSVNYLGSTLDTTFLDVDPIGAFTTLDLSGSWRPAAGHGPLRNLELRLSVQNLLNEAPDPIRNTDPAGIPFDSTNQSPIGRFVSVSVTKQW